MKDFDASWYKFSESPEAQATVDAAVKRLTAINQTMDAHQLTDFLPSVAPSSRIMLPIATIEYPERLTVGEDSFINAHLEIISGGDIKIGAHTFLGPSVKLYTANHALDKQKRREGWQYDAGITIGDDCWIGGNVTILPGLTVGNNVVIGAGSVVTRDLPDNVLAAGNPAQVLRPLDA